MRWSRQWGALHKLGGGGVLKKHKGALTHTRTTPPNLPTSQTKRTQR